ncbi:MAG: hypothetical protein EOL87_17550 [Spartobacteria bacterium]|nr:hypothetical protein [Spartobacteria bacterium]
MKSNVPMSGKNQKKSSNHWNFLSGKFQSLELSKRALRKKFQSLEQKKRADFSSDEDGQVLLMSAILALALVASVLASIPIGQTITSRIQAQNAADAAAVASTTWMARGSNMMQGLNGVFWDFDADMILYILATAARWDATIAEDTSKCGPWPWQWYWCAKIPIDTIKGSKAVREAADKHDKFAPVIADIQKTVATAVPYLAYLHANQLAGEHGVSVFNPADIAPSLISRVPILGTIIQQLGPLIQDAAKILGDASPKTWPVSFSLWPPTTHTFCKKKSPSSQWKSPLHTTSTVPFTPCIVPFLRFISWKDDWYESQNVDKTITYVTTIDKRKSLSFNDMFLTDDDRTSGKTDLVGGISAFGSAKLTGDKLYEAGIKDANYIATPVMAFPIYPIPNLRILGTYGGYGGKFESKMTSVEVMGIPGSTFLMFH